LKEGEREVASGLDHPRLMTDHRQGTRGGAENAGRENDGREI